MDFLGEWNSLRLASVHATALLWKGPGFCVDTLAFFVLFFSCTTVSGLWSLESGLYSDPRSGWCQNVGHTRPLSCRCQIYIKWEI